MLPQLASCLFFSWDSWESQGAWSLLAASCALSMWDESHPPDQPSHLGSQPTATQVQGLRGPLAEKVSTLTCHPNHHPHS